MARPSPLISAVYPRIFCATLVEMGCDVRPWLKSAGIDADNFYRPDATVTVAQFDRLIGAAEFSTGRKDLGYLTGRNVRITSHGSLGFAIVASSNMREALELACRFYRMLNPLHAMSLVEDGKLCLINFRRTVPIPPRLRFFFEESIAISAYLQFAGMAASLHPHFDVRLDLPKPGHAAIYDGFKDASFRFGDTDCEGITLAFDKRALDIVNPMSDPASVQLAAEICERKVAELDRTVGWADWVAKALRSADSVRPTRTELARVLNISPRTLERALTQENSSFKEIYERVGHERACEMLSQGGLSISEIAVRLGYGDIGGFSRAFKRRGGITPTEYLARLKASPDDST